VGEVGAPEQHVALPGPEEPALERARLELGQQPLVVAPLLVEPVALAVPVAHAVEGVLVQAVAPRVVDELAGALLDVLERDPGGDHLERRRDHDVGGVLVDRLLAAALEGEALEEERLTVEHELEEAADRGRQGDLARGARVDVEVHQLGVLPAQLGRECERAPVELDALARVARAPQLFHLAVQALDELGSNGSREDREAVAHPPAQRVHLAGGQGPRRAAPLEVPFCVQAVGPEPAVAAVEAGALPALLQLAPGTVEHG
jgi:hypothetical protein